MGKPLIGKITERSFTIIFGLQELQEFRGHIHSGIKIRIKVHKWGPKVESPSSLEKVVMKTDGYERDLRKCTVCTCRLVVTVVITNADLLELHTGKFASVHNCPC